VGEALSHKESMIKVLEEQLQAERARREAVTNRFKEQIAEFENERNALERLRRASNILEKKQMERGNASQVSISQINQSSVNELDVVPSKESHRSKVSSQASKKALNQSYRPDRVKTSIPSVKSNKPFKQPISIPTVMQQ
jgi:outer membrane protein assembly factor BamD (BamD/ComL family)